MERTQHINGHEKVTAIMGHWPSFHDAEVISLAFERAYPFQSGNNLGRMRVVVREYEPAKVGTFDFHIAFKRGALISFLFKGVGEILVADFNHQNRKEKEMCLHYLARSPYDSHLFAGKFTSVARKTILSTRSIGK